MSATINIGDDNQYEFEEITVKTTTIDKDIESLRLDPTMVRSIKLDLEGAEFLALQGAERTLNIGRPLIAMENGVLAMSVFDYDDNDVDAFLDRVDYRRISFFGEKLDTGNFDFWYMFYAPAEHVDTFASLLKGLSSGVYYKHLGGGLPVYEQSSAENSAMDFEDDAPMTMNPLDERGGLNVPTRFPELDALEIFDGTRVIEAQMPYDFPMSFTLELLLKSDSNDA